MVTRAGDVLSRLALMGAGLGAMWPHIREHIAQEVEASYTGGRQWSLPSQAYRHAAEVIRALPMPSDPRTDPFEQVKVGDPDPTPDEGDYCDAVSPDGYGCTRDPHERGKHVAGGVGEVVAVWGGESS